MMYLFLGCVLFVLCSGLFYNPKVCTFRTAHTLRVHRARAESSQTIGPSSFVLLVFDAFSTIVVPILGVQISVGTLVLILGTFLGR